MNIAQLEFGNGEDSDARDLLNTLPRPTKAKLIRVRMISFFIVLPNYQEAGSGPLPGRPELPAKSAGIVPVRNDSPWKSPGYPSIRSPLIPEDHVHGIDHLGGFGKAGHPFLVKGRNPVRVLLAQLGLSFGCELLLG